MLLRTVLRVFVVDDMSTSRGLLLQALDVLGIAKVSCAADGETAWAALRHDPSDLVLSDLHMAGMSGLDLLGRLRNDPCTKACRFVLVTASPAAAAICGASTYIPDGIVSKPFTPVQLRDCIETVVGPL